MPIVSQELYGLTGTITGFCFLGPGGGVIAGGTMNGKRMDWSV